MDKYEQDETGQWWCQTPRGNRLRVREQTCGQCGRGFLNRHPQRFCSKECVGKSQRGIYRAPREPRDCAWCGKTFTPAVAPSNAPLCCSRRCQWDLGNSKRGLPGDRNPNWRGGVAPHGTSGYIRQYVAGRGIMLQHRVVMEQMLGRRLEKGENVHHKNGVRDDNRPENLELWVKKQPPGQRKNEQRHCPTCTCAD